MSDFALSLGLDFKELRGLLQDAKGVVRDFVTGSKEEAGHIFDGAKESAFYFTQQVETARTELSNLAGFFSSIFSDASASAKKELGISSRFKREFGDSAAAAEDFSKQLGSSLARSTPEIESYLTKLNFVTKNMGFAKDAGQALSKTLVEAGYDFAAARGLETADAMGVLQSALTGNVRALRQYGISISDTAEQEKALQLGLDPAHLTRDQEATVRLQIVTDALAESKGAAAKAAQGTAGAFRTLENETESLRAKIGQAYNEAIAPFVKWSAAAVKSIREWTEAHPKLTEAIVGGFVAFGGLTTGVVAFLGAISGGVSLVNTFTTSMVGLSRAVSAIGNLTGLGTAVASLGAELGIATGGVVALGIALVAAVAVGAYAISSARNDIWELTTDAGKAVALLRDLKKEIGQSASTDDVKNVQSLSKAMAGLGGQFSQQVADYKRLRKEGVDAQTALGLATEEHRQFEYLLNKETALSAEETSRLITLQLNLIDNLKDPAMRSASEQAAAYAAALADIKANAEAVKKAVDETQTTLAKQKLGNGAVDAVGARNEAKARQDVLTKAANDELTAIDYLNKRRADLSGEGLRTQEQEIEQHRQRLKSLNEAIIQNDEATALRIKEIEDKRTQEIQDAGQKRIEAVRKETDDLVKEYDKQISEIEREFKRLKQLDDDASAEARNLANEYEQAILRQKDAKLADIKADKERTEATLAKGVADADGSRLMDATAAKLRLDADLTKELADAQQKATTTANQAAEARSAENAARQNLGHVQGRADQSDDGADKVSAAEEQLAQRVTERKRADQEASKALTEQQLVRQRQITLNEDVAKSLDDLDKVRNAGDAKRDDRAAQEAQLQKDQLDAESQKRQLIYDELKATAEIGTETQKLIALEKERIENNKTILELLRQQAAESKANGGSQGAVDKAGGIDNVDMKAVNEEYARRRFGKVAEGDSAPSLDGYANAEPSVPLSTDGGSGSNAQADATAALKDYMDANMDTLAGAKAAFTAQAAMLKTMTEKLRQIDLENAAQVDLAGTGLSDV